VTDTPSDAQTTGPRSESASQTVLYVEDHPVNVLLMQALFDRRPALRLLIAVNGAEALQIAATQPIDLLLLDLRLPDCHGTQLLQQLRTMAGLTNVPAVAVTAEDTTGVIEGGFCEIWHKPMDMQTTLLRLDRLLTLPGVEQRAEELSRTHRVRAWRLSPTPIPFPVAVPAPELGSAIARPGP
jgi:CheY-like chemotaxis protein